MIANKEVLCLKDDVLKFDLYVKKRISKKWTSDVRQNDRLMILKNFLNSNDYVLDVGCGEVEPKIICDYTKALALDIAPSGLTNLKNNNFKGHLILASCTNLPLKDKSIEKSICSEVIEHLPKDNLVKKCIDELERVSKKYLVTTPNNQFTFRWLESTHVRFFNKKNIKKLFPKECQIKTSNIPQASVEIPILPYFLLDKGHTTLGKYFQWFDRKFRRSFLGKLIRRMISGLLGNAFILATYESNLNC